MVTAWQAEFPEFKDKVAVVTGGGRGLGKTITEALAAHGARVVACDIDASAVETLARPGSVSAGVVTAVSADVSDAADVEKTIAVALDRFGRLDILINNAGITHHGRPLLTDIDEAEFDRVIGVNLKGVWLGMKHAIPAMLRTGGGSIVNISSAMGLVAQAGVSIYAASKHGVVGLTKAAAIEFGRRGIRVNAICPGRHETPMVEGWRDVSDEQEWQAQIVRLHPATGRIGTASEVANATLFLCSNGASNIHGVALPVDGGWTAQ